MTDFARRSIPELIARHELAPELDDIYVEGVFDKELLTSAFGVGSAKRTIYEIDTVDVPFEVLDSNGLTDGCKQRVIALARELAKIDADCSYLCLVDKDLDHWFEAQEQIKRLRWTKYCSIELQFYTTDILRQLLVVTCKAHISDFDIFQKSMTSILSGFYALRLADRQLSYNLRWVSFDACLSVQGDVINFKLEDYVNRMLTANGKNKLIKDFMVAVDKYMTSFAGDERNHIRGHDFIELLVWAIKKYRGIRELASEVALQRILILLAPSLKSILEEID